MKSCYGSFAGAFSWVRKNTCYPALLATGLLLFSFSTQIQAQFIVVGPPDDQTVIDTSYHPAPPQLQNRIQPLTGLNAAGVTSIDLSQLDCSGFPGICLYVDALDNLGNPVSGLTKDSFCLYQDGTPISNFTVQQLSAGNCITNVCLVVDVSGSMGDDHKIDSAKAAMHRFVNNMDVYDQVAIVTFSNCWSVLQSFTSNKTTLNNAINTISANGNTAAFDGIWKGVDITKLQLGSKAVIAFTDGLENRSQSCSPNPPDGVSDNAYSDDSTFICGLANSASLPIYTFNLGPIDTTFYNPAAMKAFAKGTGGTWAHAPTGAQIDSLYSKIKTKLCSRYFICYNSLDTIQNGDTHWTKVCKKTGPTCSPCDSSSCQEKDSPKIVRTPTTINLSNSCQSYNSPISICTYVTDKDTPKASLVVTLYYRTGPSSYTSLPMSPTGPAADSTFCASIPVVDLKCQSFVDYYITASDSLVTVSAPSVNPQVSPYNFTLCPNHAPVANAGANQTIFQCTGAQICLPASCSDVDGNLKTCQLISGPGTYNGSQICFTPSGTLNYEFVIKATDSCGLTGFDTVVVFYTLNSAPVANAGRDSTLFLCAAQQICWPASCSDPNGNLSSCQLLSGPGTYNGTNICFTPAASGSYQFVLKATDSCGLTKQDTAVIAVTINTAPVCHIPNDTTINLCSPTQVCLPVSATDVNNNLRSCQIVTGPGSLAGGNWCYTPPATQTVAITVRCEDSCNAFCQSTFNVHFIVNPAPLVTFGADTTIFQCTPAQICLPYAVTDGNGNVALEQLLSGSGSIDTALNRVCFTPAASGIYSFVVRATDACNTTGQDTINVTVNLNHAPVASAGPDQTVFQCAATQICWAASCSDIDNNLDSCKLLSGPGTYNGSAICFTPGASGLYTFVIRAVDHCGLSNQDTVKITVTINSTPTIAFGADTTLFMCSPQQVCLGYSVSDPNGPSKLTEAMISGFGSIDTALNKVCFTPAATGSYQIIVSVTDSCGASKRDTINANVTIGQPASIACPGSPITKFLCTSGQICQPLTITPGSATVTPSFGTYSAGNLCFQADTTGVYHIRVIAITACSSDTCNLTFNVTLNHSPVANAGPDATVFQCVPTPICWPASCSDIDNNLDSCKLISGPGTYNGSNICFTPASSGIYTFVIRAVDQCGLSNQDTVKITVTANGAPNIAFGNDTTMFLCAPQQICLNYSISDPNGLGKLSEAMVSGFGTLDTANNKVCFTPASAGTYDFIVSVTDSCGATDRDTIRAIITFGSHAAITCIASPINASLCATGQVCQALAISPAGATVTTSFGTYSAGNLCFQADTSGTYHIRVIAATTCNSDTCNLTFNVTIGTAAQVSCPPTQTKFICQPGSLCIPVGIVAPGGTVTVTPIGSYSAGNLCFQADTSGHYVIKIKATTTCGSDSCQVVANVTIDAPPVAVNPATPKDTFMCASAQICYQFSATDPNGGALTWSKLSGSGAITSGGLWCFTPVTAGSYSISAVISDSCGKADTTTLTYNVTQNVPPITHLGNDTTIFICTGGSICLPYTVTDANNNITLEQLTSGPGTIDTVLNKVCFTPGSPGAYTFVVTGTDACNASSSDTINVTVAIGQAPLVSCPGTQTKFLCAAANICYPVTVAGTSPIVTVTPIGTFSAGNVCFQADTTGHYVIKVKATNSCGADSCQIVVNVTINSRPVAVNPTTPKDTFVCALNQICYQFSASDPNGGALTWSRLSGAGTVTAGGLWCFTPAGSGSYTSVAVVTDSCGAADTTTLTYNITANLPPTISLGVDQVKALCGPTPVCINYTVADPNNNAVLEQLISGPGTIDTVTNKVCFTPAVSGISTIIVKVTDACGATAQDTVNVTVNLNQPPVVDAGTDAGAFQCTPSQLCFPITVSDPNGNLDSVKLASGTGTIVNSAGNRTICFTPSASGIYTFIVRVTDSCGASDQDTVKYTITENTPPVCHVPADTTTYFQCVPTQVSLPVTGTDIDNNFDHCEIVSGPGSIASGVWSYTPSVNEVRKVVVKCLDQCGAYCTDSFYVRFKLNAPPVVNAGNDTTVFFCQAGQVCWNTTASDPDNNLTSVALLSGPGTYNSSTHQICANVGPSGGLTQHLTFILKATDTCNVSDQDTVNVTVNFNHAPTIQAPPDFTAYMEQGGPLCFDLLIFDVDANLDSIKVAPFGSYNTSTAQLCLQADTSGTYCVRVTAKDRCGESTVDTICVTVAIDECMHVQIEKTHNAIQGQFEPVNIFLNGSGKLLGGFNFLIAYDASALTPMGVTPGLLFTNCGWEYFTYRQGANGNCGSGCPTGLLRIVGVAETNNGAYHPTCYLDGLVGSLALVNFLVTNDRTMECQYSPIRFYWENCADNAMSSLAGDTLWISRKVYDFEMHDITQTTGSFPTFAGAPDPCMIGGGPGKPGPQRCIDFTDGGVDIICADSIDARGDINLNEVGYEIADAVMFSNYFIYGLPAFGNDPQHIQGSIAASDVNADGLALSVADLVYLIRVITGDAAPFSKVVPGTEPVAQFDVFNGILQISRTDAPIGAIYLVIPGDAHPRLHEDASQMELKYHFDGENTRVLISDMTGKGSLLTGPVMYLVDAHSVKSLEAGSYDGAVINAKLHSLPTTYELSQNYPNPFNPITRIEFALPAAGKWNLTVFNILGQEVATFGDESTAGYYKIDWDASKYSSGVYFYRLSAGSFTATKKMVLLK